MLQLEKFKKMQDKNHQKMLNEEPDSNFNLIENLEMYIKMQGEEEELSTRNKFKLDEDMSSSLINKAPSQDLIF